MARRPKPLPVALMILLTTVACLPAVSAAMPRPAASDVLTVDTLATFAFAPSTLSVQPGAHVELEVTQMSTTEHTFVLSSVPNSTIPTTDSAGQVFQFLNSHPPLVNLTIPGTEGAVVYTNFTAPAQGTWEFFCEIPGHLQAGMYGELDSGPSSSSSSGLPITTVAAIGVVVVVVVAAVAVLLLRRRRPAPPKV